VNPNKSGGYLHFHGIVPGLLISLDRPKKGISDLRLTFFSSIERPLFDDILAGTVGGLRVYG
jgi:hypothetical protein